VGLSQAPERNEQVEDCPDEQAAHHPAIRPESTARNGDWVLSPSALAAIALCSVRASAIADSRTQLYS